ncbi:hypothetical protein C1Y42_22380 [Pantoea sp. ICBG 985]|uniref:hypothetical protein n=1 Tax=Pantoea sp. ICBG 985 TaxID=2071683 RepID=UPI000CE3988A|nr:hypothetical protein [Pantoea sp. ICBG 985]PPC67092.1 hypothetical protein C1Y42_22380 [Pantoea sp. ICBG 985]
MEMSNKYGIPQHLFKCWQPEDESWSMTPATYASRFIQKMEKRYGMRDRNWTYVGVDFHDEGPRIWFPGNRETPPRGHIAISLSVEAYSDRQEMVYQLAHECVHLLAPVVGDGAPVIEEGLATVFSEDMIEFWCNNTNKQAYTVVQKYREAASRVRDLLRLEPEAIKKLRAVQPDFYRMTNDTFERAALEKVPPSLIDELLSKFKEK